MGFRVLAPREPQNQEGSFSTPQTSTNRLLWRCRVCHRINCKLRSHKLHRIRMQGYDNAHSERHANLTSDDNFHASYACVLARQFVGRNIAASKIDPFYNLPVDPKLNTPEMHALFYNWFVIEAQKIFFIPAPDDVIAENLVGPLMAPALFDSALCYSVLAMAALVVPQGDNPISDMVIRTLIARAIEQIRQQTSLGQESVSDFVIGAVAVLWGVNWYLHDTQAVRRYGRVVSDLLKSKKDLGSLVISNSIIRFVLWTDVFISNNALRTNCCFPVASLKTQTFQPGPTPNGRVWKLEASIEDFDSAVISAFRECTQLMQILDQSELNGPTALAYRYMFIHLPISLAEDSNLLPKFWGANDCNEYVVLAMYLVKMNAFLVQPATIRGICKPYTSRLCEAMEEVEESRPQFWQEHSRLLVWLLFTVFLTVHDLEESVVDTCVRRLHKAALSQFGMSKYNPLPENWQSQLKLHLAEFPWASTRFSVSFEDTCARISKHHARASMSTTNLLNAKTVQK